ncbi:MAG: Spy/CpxP family protein refolding chaperone [Hyphomicrobiaceae bacterium]
MNRTTKLLLAFGAVATLGLAGAIASADTTIPSPGAAGPGFGMGYGPGFGGHMGGFGMMGYGGPGMAHGAGFGPGAGMMGGWGAYGYGITGLTDAQRAQIDKISEQFQQQRWALMQSMHAVRWNQSATKPDGTFDEQAARKTYEAMAALRQQMFDSAIEQRKQIEAVLTPQQREQLRSPAAVR